MHAEAVLLVDDGKPEALEFDRLLHEGVGADDAADLPGGDRRAPRRALTPLQAGGQQRHADAERLQQPAKRREVLLGENLRRRHHRRLVPRLHRRAYRQRGHHGLAGADVPLQQPVHRVRRGHVAADVVPHAFLRRRQREGQARAQPAEQLAARPHGHAALPRRARAQNSQAELQEEEVVEGQAAHGVRALAFTGGEMRTAHGLGQRHEPPPRAHWIGQRLLDVVGVGLDEAPDQRAQRLLWQSLGARVHGDERAGVDRLVVGGLHRFPLLHLQADLVLVARAAAVHDHPLPTLHGTGDPRAAPDGGRGVAALVAQHDLQRMARAPGRRRADTDHDAGARCDLARADGAQWGEARAVLVAQRQVEERVADGDQALPLELLRAVRPHPLHVLQGRRESDGRARLPALGHRGIKPAGSRPFAIRLRRSAIRLEE